MMTRSSQHKEKLVIRSEIHREDGNEGTAARTRPFSYDEIMLRRKNKKKSAEPVAKPVEAGKSSGEVSRKEVPYRNAKLSSAIVAKHSSEDIVKVNSRYNEDNMSKDRISRNIRSKPTMNRDFSDKAKRSMDDRRDQWSRRHDNWSNGKIGNEYERIHPRHLIERERYTDKNRGRPVKDFDRKPRNDYEERNSEREFKRKQRFEDEERSTLQNAVKRHDSGERHDQEVPDGKNSERKERNELSRFHDEESRSKKKRSRSKEPDKDKGRRSEPDSGKRHDHEAPMKRDHERKEKKKSSNFRNEESNSFKERSRSRERDMDKGRRSASLSPHYRRRTEHGNGSPHSSKDRFKREQADDERNRNFNNGSSGLGGYSPRKRKTEAEIKNPVENNNSTLPVLPNLPPLSHNMTSNMQELPNMPLVLPNSIIRGVFSYASVDSVQLTQATRPMRRLYVENLPDSASEKTVMECLNNFLLSSGVNRVPGSQPCISCSINKEKGQALVEFLTPEDASAALYFDGRVLSGSVLKIRRPKDYTDVATGVTDKSVVKFDSSSNFVRDSPNKIFIGGVSKVISSEMLREIAAVFGPLKAFHFEVNADRSGPCAFLEYVDQSVTLKACAGLNAMRLGGQMLTVVQATPNSPSVENFGNPPFYGIPDHAKPLLQKPTQVLKLKNVLNPDDISTLSEKELDEILEDVRLECSRFGTVNSVNIVKHCDDTGSIKDMKTEPHGEQIDGKSQETAMLETCQAPDGTVSAEDICTISIKNLKTEHIEEKLDSNSQNEDEKSLEEKAADNSETIAKKLAIENNQDKNNAKTEPVIEEILKTEQVLEMNQSEKEENKETVSNLENGFELGSVLVEYKRIEASSVAAHSLHGRLFDDRIVAVGYMDFDIYRARFLK